SQAGKSNDRQQRAPVVSLSTDDQRRLELRQSEVEKKKPDVWQVTRWALPQRRPVDDLLKAVAENARGYKHVIVAGTGPMADALTSALMRSGLTGDALVHVNAIQSGDQLPTAADKSTVVIRVTDEPADAVSPNEQIVLDPDIAVSAAEYLRSTAALLRVGQGLLKDPRTIASPLLRTSAEKLQAVVGDWSTPEAKAILERWGDAIDKAERIEAVWHDMDAASHGNWQWQNSEMFAKLVDLGAKAGLTSLFKMLPEDVLSTAEANKLGDSLGIGDFAEGVKDTIIHGDITVEAWEHYLDATVAVTWTDVGLLVSGENV